MAKRFITRHRAKLEFERKKRDAIAFAQRVEAAVSEHEQQRKREDAALKHQPKNYAAQVVESFPLWQKVVRRSVHGDASRLIEAVCQNSTKDVESTIVVCTY